MCMYLQNLIRTKGQGISKGKFDVFNSSKKTNQKLNLRAEKLLRSFFGRIEDTTLPWTQQFLFEIKLSLLCEKIQSKHVVPCQPNNLW